MTTVSFEMPRGDPAELRSRAARFGMLAGAHGEQLAQFKRAVEKSLDGWTGGFATDYAISSGEACGRFTAVAQTLMAAREALEVYAIALEDAQHAMGQLNGQFEELDRVSYHERTSAGYAASMASLDEQAADVRTSLGAAERACASSLVDARARLAAACPDTLTSSQLLTAVKEASRHITSVVGLRNFEAFLSDWALYATALAGRKGREVGEILATSRSILKELDGEIGAAVQKLLEHVQDPDPVLSAWEELATDAAAARDAAQAAANLRGTSFLAGLLKGASIGIEEAGEHAAEQAFLDSFMRSEPLGLLAAGASIFFGVHDAINPGGGPGWEQDGNRAAGAASAVGGTGVVVAWALRAARVGTPIPGVDGVVDSISGTLLAGAALWSLGDFAYNERHNIAGYYDDARHWVAHEGDNVLHAPGEFARALTDAVNPDA